MTNGPQYVPTRNQLCMEGARRRAKIDCYVYQHLHGGLNSPAEIELYCYVYGNQSKSIYGTRSNTNVWKTRESPCLMYERARGSLLKLESTMATLERATCESLDLIAFWGGYKYVARAGRQSMVLCSSLH